MNGQSTFTELQTLLKKNTQAYLRDQKNLKTSLEMADQLAVSRTVVSRYLNKLYEQKELIKISTRPVIYLSRKILEDALGLTFKQDEFLSLKEFTNYLEKNSSNYNKAIVIGEHLSLNESVIKLESFFKQHNRTKMLAIVAGPRGTGKKFVTTSIFKRLNWKSNQQRKLVYLEGSDIQENFWSADLLSQYPDSLIYISNAEKIPVNSQKALVRFIDGEIEETKPEKENVWIVLGTMNPGLLNIETRVKEISSYIVRFPALSQRSKAECEELLLHYFQKEMQGPKIDNIRISTNAFRTMVNATYKNNIDDLIRAVQITIANAIYTDRKTQPTVTVEMYHLPENLLRNLNNSLLDESVSYYELNQMTQNPQNFQLSNLCQKILSSFEEGNDESGFLVFRQKVHKIVMEYGERINRSNDSTNPRILIYENIISMIFKKISDSYGIIAYSECTRILANLLYFQTYQDSLLLEWSSRSNMKINRILAEYKRTCKNEYLAAKEVTGQIKYNLGVDLLPINLIFVIESLHMINFAEGISTIAALVIAHGPTTASSIVTTVNRLLDKRLFYPFDLSLEADSAEIVIQIEKFLTHNPDVEDLILMVDMGSLEDIGQILVQHKNIRIGVINNISTKTVLSVGDLLRKNESMDYILSRTCQDVPIAYRIFEQKKKDVIIFTTDTGEVATKRLIEVFKKSLPKKTGLQFICCSKNELDGQGYIRQAMNEWNVVMVTGLTKPDLENVPFIPIENIVEFKKTDTLNQIFARYFTTEELDLFNANLIKNFTLNNLIEQLTILNPAVLLDAIENAINQLEHNMAMNLTSHTRILLYLHISAMVERLVTRQVTVEYPNVETFITSHRKYVDAFQDSFQQLSRDYNVEIPKSETAFLYDYIFTELPRQTSQPMPLQGELFND